MKINIVKIDDKWVVREEDAHHYYCLGDTKGNWLFNTEAEAKKVYDIVTAIKNPEVVR